MDEKSLLRDLYFAVGMADKCGWSMSELERVQEALYRLDEYHKRKK